MSEAPLYVSRQFRGQQRRQWLEREHARKRGRCHYCLNTTILLPRGHHVAIGAGTLLELWATVDHATPVSRGGNDGPDNWRLACRVCNILKGAQPEAAFIAELQREGIR